MDENFAIQSHNTVNAWKGKWIIEHTARFTKIEAFLLINSISDCLKTKTPLESFERNPAIAISIHEDLRPGEVLQVSSIPHLQFGINSYDFLTRPDDVIMKLADCIVEMLAQSTDEHHLKRISRLAPKKAHLKLIYGRSGKENRWGKMGTPAAMLLLGSAAKSSGHNVSIQEMFFSDHPSSILRNENVIGIGLYEDNFEEFHDLIQRFRAIPDIWIIAGGPMASLLPIQTAVHLNGVDFILRGEAETTLPKLLDIIADSTRQRGLPPMFYDAFFDIEGCLFIGKERIISSEFSNCPVNESLGHIRLDYFLSPPPNFSNGLEYSTSRGCNQSCLFCSHVHGKGIRKYDLNDIFQDLDNYSKFIGNNELLATTANASTVNLNDDDILADPFRCLELLNVVRSTGFKIWGLQASLESLINLTGHQSLFERISDPVFYAHARPVFWIGTDAFSNRRLLSLGKKGSLNGIELVCNNINKFKGYGYHYWIMTDADSDWDGFFLEVTELIKLKQIYADAFHVLPNAASLVPYSSSAIYRQRVKMKKIKQIVFKREFRNESYSGFNYSIPSHERPISPYLYAFVEPRAAVPEKMLFNAWNTIQLVKTGDFYSLWRSAYQAMKLECEDSRCSKKRKVVLTRLRCDLDASIEILGDPLIDIQSID